MEQSSLAARTCSLEARESVSTRNLRAIWQEPKAASLTERSN
jgi:hypothetical protein